MESQIVLPGVERRLVDDPDQPLDRTRRRDIHLVELCEIEITGGKHLAPVETGEILLERVKRVDIVGLVAIAQLRARPVDLRDLGLERQDTVRGRAGRRLVHAGEAEHARDMRPVGVADRPEALGVLEIIVAVREAEARLADREEIVVRVLAIDRHAAADRCPRAVDVRAGEGLDQIVLARDRRDARKIGFQGFGAQRIQVLGIHVAREIVPDHLFDRTRRRLLFRQILDDLSHPLFGAIAQDQERAVARLVGLELVGLEPGAVGIAEEIVTGLDAFVTRRKIDAPVAELRLGRVRRRRCGALILSVVPACGEHPQRTGEEKKLDLHHPSFPCCDFPM